MTTSRFSAIATALLLVACGPSAAPNKAAAATQAPGKDEGQKLAAEQPTPDGRSDSQHNDLEVASKAALGSMNGFKKDDVDGTIVKAERLVKLPFGFALITSETAEDGDRARYGSLGIYYLRREGDGFKLIGSWPGIVRGTHRGQVPQRWSVTTKFTHYPAVYSETEHGNQGMYCGDGQIVELKPTGPESSTFWFWSEQLALFGQKGHHLNGRIADIRRGKSFDVIVSGTSRFTEHYIYKAGKFVLPRPNDLLACSSY